ncbi:integrase, catalytic region, zinc finger, CCHC-type containing protein [Tanacetum coccineum]
MVAEVPQTLEYRGGQLNAAPMLEDFQDSLDDDEDTRDSQEYLNDLEEEFQERALLAKSRRTMISGVKDHEVRILLAFDARGCKGRDTKVFRAPQVIISDNRKQFAEGIFLAFCQRLGIHQSFTFIYHPQANKQVEVTNIDIVNGMEQRLGKNHQDWVDELPQVLWVHKTSAESSNEETPFSLTYSSESVDPIEISVETKQIKEFEVKKNEKRLREKLDLLEEQREIASIQEAYYKQKLDSQHRVAKRSLGELKCSCKDVINKAIDEDVRLYDEFDKFTYKKGESLHDKFVTDVKLVKDLHTTNVDQLHAYLEQHERHANEVRLMHERNSDPLALVASHQITQLPYQTHQHTYQNTQLQAPALTYPSSQNGSPYQSQQYSTHQSSTPLSGRQTSFAADTSRTYTPGASGSNSRKQRTVICYNCKGEGHMSRQCTKPKRKRDDSWFKEKVLLVQAQAHGQILNEEELAFLADPDILEAVQVMSSSQQSNVVNHSETEITSDSTYHSLFSINLENKSVNDTLTAELERYKEQVKVLKEEETLALAEENRSKMLLKHKDNMMLEKEKQGWVGIRGCVGTSKGGGKCEEALVGR